MPTEECHVDVNGLKLMLRDGVKAAQLNLDTATTNRMKWESRMDTDIIVWEKGKEERLLSFVCVKRHYSHCQGGQTTKF
jgi:hypothetical protein